MMAKENLAEMPENYDMMDEVKASAVMNETEEQKIVASNVNDNQEGENPPLRKEVLQQKQLKKIQLMKMPVIYHSL